MVFPDYLIFVKVACTQQFSVLHIA